MAADAARQTRFPFAAKATVRRAQERRIRAIVTYASAHVPYYREQMRRLLLGPEDLRTADDLARLPLLEREQIQRDPEYYVSDEWPLARCIAIRSGGTTGTPVTIFRDPPSLLAEAGHYQRLRSVAMRLASRRLRCREALVVPQEGSTSTLVSALRARSRLPRGLRAQLLRLSMWRPLSEVLDDIERYRPDVLTAFGSYLDALFAYVRQEGRKVRLPPVVVYGADAISATARAWARDERGIEVLSTYGAIEATHIGFECERHRGHHLNIDLYPVRLLEGELVISNLVNRGTVLLNYRLGDQIDAIEDPCPCGRSLPLCSYLGRTKAAWLDLGDGRTVHAQALRLVVRDEREIFRYQIVQQARRSFLIRLVPTPDCDREATASRVSTLLSERLNDGVAVRIEFMADLPREGSGKVQQVVVLGD